MVTASWRPAGRCKLGFTLLEAAIVMGLLMALMALVTTYFIRGKRYAAETETYSSVQRSASQSFRRLTDDLYRATSRHLQVRAREPGEGASIFFLSFEPAGNNPDEPYLEFEDFNGSIIWKKWVCYYHDTASHSLIRGEVPLQNPGSALATRPAPQGGGEVSAEFFRNSASVKRRTVGQNVDNFAASGAGQVRLSLTVKGLAPVSGSTISDREVEVNVSTEVSLLHH